MSKNLFDIFEENVKNKPNKTAIIYKNIQLTYQEFYNNIKTLSYHLNKIGVKKDTHIAVFENNSIEFATILLSCAYLGATIVPLPLTLKGENQLKSLNSTDSEFIIGWHTVIKNIKDKNIYSDNNLISLSKRVGDCHFYDDFLKDEMEFFINYKVPSDTNYILTMTSGSTGNPKPIIFSQQTKIDRSLLATRDVYKLSDYDVILTSTPLYHSLAQRSLILPLLLGASSVILPKFTPKSWLEAVSTYKITFLFAVSTQLDILINSDLLQNYDLNSLNTIISSSALLKDDTRENLLAKFSCDIYEIYGASEVGVVTNILIKEKLGSVGKALSFVDIKIVNNEITCKTKTAFKGYYKNEKATYKSYDNNGYFYTGDLGEVDEDGYLFYKGRTKEIIITGGINVYPKDIENIINKFNEVDECVVVGKSDSYFGEKVIALMTQKENKTIDIKAIQKKCLENLIDYQIPQQFIILDKFPKSGLGKILKNEIII